MTKIKCLIVDDEPIAREILKKYCGHLDMLSVVASCSSALEAKAELQKQAIDLIFLDINMPVLDGVAFLKTIKSPPQIIFTTAYKEYALDAFDLSACDYLLKPFSLERFIVAVDKAIERIRAQSAISLSLPETRAEDYLFIKAEGKIYKILYQDLSFAEAQGNNTKLLTTQQVLAPAMTLTSLEKLLPKSLFVRVHRSFIINKAKITHIEGNRVFIGKNEIPVGSRYRDQFLKEIGI